MDIEKRNALVVALGDLDAPDNYNDYVSLEAFFDGNDDPGSMWCNLDEPPDTADETYRFLRSIRERHDVADILVRVIQVEDGEWPFSDSVVIVTDESGMTVRSWFEKYPPDEVFEEDDAEYLSALGHPDTSKAIRLWWD